MTTDYPLFEHWYKTLNWLLDRCERMPKDVRFTVSSRIAALGTEILECIIEAIYTRERQELLRGINLRLEKLRFFMRLCHDRKYIATTQYEFAARCIDEAGKMCGGWMKQSAQVPLPT